jgi:O-acetyl-ADP-ribose deacetylase (regulator of RNase III)
MITYVHQNLLLTPDDIIAHGCNAQGVMGSGVALSIKKAYPKAYDDYVSFCNEIIHAKYPVPKSDYMGFVQNSAQPNGKIILNCITQDTYGYDGKMYASYDAIDIVMHKIGLGSRAYGYKNVSMPKIGSCRGGLDWDVVEAIIKHRCVGLNVSVYYL